MPSSSRTARWSGTARPSTSTMRPIDSSRLYSWTYTAARVRSAGHARQKRDERANLAVAQRLSEVRRHHAGAVAGGNERIRVDDRRLDALIERRTADAQRRRRTAVVRKTLGQVRPCG